MVSEGVGFWQLGMALSMGIAISALPWELMPWGFVLGLLV
jgi:hypothetical protein